MSDIILRLPQLKIRVGLSRSSIYATIAEGKFPGPVRLGARAVGWLESEITTWVQMRVKQSVRNESAEGFTGANNATNRQEAI